MRLGKSAGRTVRSTPAQAGRFDAGDVNRLDLADVAEDGVELAGEAVQLGFGEREPGQSRQVGNLVSGDLGHD